MNVKCDLACPGLRRNLLVEHSRYYEPHASRSPPCQPVERARRAEISDFYLRRTESPAKVCSTVSRSFWPSNGVLRNSSVPNFIAFTVIAMSPYPVIKMIEI